MIITEKKPSEELKESLKGYKRIFLIGCGECATACKTGGAAEILEAQKALEEMGKFITGTCIPQAPCLASQVKAELAKHSAALRESDAVLIFACGLGVQSVKDNSRLDLTVIPALDSVCGAVMDAKGSFIEKCSTCGECSLAQTAGICAVTLCPKGLANGPCGGVNKGKCELDPDKDCAWVLIYNELARKNRTKDMMSIRKARDFKKSVKPHVVRPG